MDRSPLPSPFLRSWWLTATAGPHPRFLLVLDEDQLLGGLALEEDRRLGLPSFRMMGSGSLCPDHLDLLAAGGHEDATTSALRKWLCRPGGRVMDLQGIRGGSRLIESLPGPVRSEEFAVAPFAPLPEGSGAYLSALPSQFRRNLRRGTARLAAEGVTHREHRGAAAIRSLGTLKKLHLAQWGDRSRFLPDFDRFAAGCRMGAEADEVVVHELGTDGSAVSVVLAFEVGGRVSLYQSARRTEPRWRDATSVLLNAIITDACDRGLSEVDFLRGEEPYKGRFTSKQRTMSRLMAGNGRPGRVASASRAAAAGATRVAVRSVRAGRAAVARAKT